MSAAPPPPPYAVPIAARPPKSWLQLAHGTVALALFLTGCVMIHATQLLFVLPLRLLPGSRPYEDGVRYTKGAFALLITLACQLFAPTALRVTFATDGIGAFGPDDLAHIVERDAAGRVSALRLPKKMVIVANHQIYADWLYVWCLTYFMGMHKDVLIVLKRSLKWVPVLGWGMQIFRFIFLARSWASDRSTLVATLAELGRKAQQAHTPLAFIIYPEGTLVSRDTRPVSTKFAEREGIPDTAHTLLPRSTGLHYALRALAPRVPDLKLLDITVAYPGIPPMGYGQMYYTLRSIFMDRVPPPVVHMHLRLLDVARDVPIGDLSVADPTGVPRAVANGHAVEEGAGGVEAAVPEAERAAFEAWLRALWRVKDETLDAFYRSGARRAKEEGGNAERAFGSAAPPVEVPVALRSAGEALDAFCFFGPALAGWVARRVRG
ncbi:acyltransferase-domain-containing protein [Phellopilus nigrolimitatus]|nr:acyltransferase-domain-containing protein [Phellopilus nigrolimitatus]